MKKVPGRAPLVVPAKTQRDRIVERARRVVDAVTGGKDLTGLCLYHAFAVIAVGRAEGLELAPQAGSASWLRMPLERDDGVVATHFSYVWEGPHVPAGAPEGWLPEIHVWAADVKRREIIDTTTRDLPETCPRNGGLAWEAPTPPDYLWSTSIPRGWHYEPNEEATRFAVALVSRGLETRCGVLASIIEAHRSLA